MEWISVKDRLPEEGDWILMYISNYRGVDNFRAGMYFKDKDGYDWLSAANLFGQPTVTHWQPLPEPPK